MKLVSALFRQVLELIQTPISVPIDVTGMDSYPVSSQLLEYTPEPLLAVVLGGVGFMGLALALLLGSACVVSRKMGRRCRQKKDGKNHSSLERIRRHSL